MIRFPDHPSPENAARRLISRSILGSSIHELWGTGTNYPELHASIKQESPHLWPRCQPHTFRFDMDSFQGSQSQDAQRSLIEAFAYTKFTGRIRMKDPVNSFTIFEHYVLNAPAPSKIYFGRLIAHSKRKATLNQYTLKKRGYIATTSMDAELSLVTANMVQANPGRLAYDPFMGTGSFPLACAHFGSAVFGSDLDGRSIRGKGSRSVASNFKQYSTSSCYLGGFVADLTNTPMPTGRGRPFLDHIVCDPPYGVREGLKVLGSNKDTPAAREAVYLTDGTLAHLASDYLPPKKPYSFTRMLDDVLDFAAETLIAGGRLGMWMPVAPESLEADGEGEAAEEKAQESTSAKSGYAIPCHPCLELVSECTQHFNKCRSFSLRHSSPPPY